MKRKVFLLGFRIAVMLWLGWGIVGCGGKEEGVVARVGDQLIRVGDFQRMAQRLRGRYRDQTPREMLQPLIDRKIMVLEATKRGLEEDARVRAAVESARIRQLTEKVYEEEVTKKVVVSEEEVQIYFKEQGLDKKRELRASHIMVETLKEAQVLRRRLMEGADFAELARETSIDTATALKGGDLGYWPEENTRVSPFVRELFRLNVGEISEPYQDARGNVHLIKATEERPIGLDRQRKKIQRILEHRKRNERWRAYLHEQAAGFHLEMDEETLFFLLEQGRLAVDRVPPIPPGDRTRVLFRYDGGVVDLEAYVEMIRGARLKRRPIPVDSMAVAQFARHVALAMVLLPKVAQARRWDRAKEVQVYLEEKWEEAMIEALRRLEVEDRILREEVLRDYYEHHREDLVEPARSFVERGIVGEEGDAREIAARVHRGEDLAEVMRAYPRFTSRWRAYDVFQYSPSDTSQRRGILGQMIEAARGLDAGGVKGPLRISSEQDEAGYVVLRVLEVRPARPLPLDDPSVRKKVLHERSQEVEAAFDRYIHDLRGKYHAQVVVYEDVLTSAAAQGEVEP